MDKKTWGCLQVLIGLVYLPAWFAFIYMILTKIETTTVMWCLYCSLIPFAVLGSVVGSVVKLVFGEE